MTIILDAYDRELQYAIRRRVLELVLIRVHVTTRRIAGIFEAPQDLGALRTTYSFICRRSGTPYSLPPHNFIYNIVGETNTLC